MRASFHTSRCLALLEIHLEMSTLFVIATSHQTLPSLPCRTDLMVHVTVKTFTGRTISFDVNGSASVKSIKYEIQVWDWERAPPNQQGLFLGDKWLCDHDVIAQYTHGTSKQLTLHLMESCNSGFPILVKILAENTVFVIEAEASASVQNVKTKIWNLKGISTDQQMLTFNGTKLEDSRTLSSYSIERESSKIKQLGAIFQEQCSTLFFSTH